MSGRHRLKRGVKLFISVAFFSGTYLWNLARRITGMKPRFGCIVLYYHALPVEHRQSFAKQMEQLVRLTVPISIDRPLPPGRGIRYSAVTFDDAFESALDNAVPELAKRKIPAVVFVTTDVLGTCASWWPKGTPEHKERIASAEQLRALPMDLITVGSHTRTHPVLPSLSEEEATRELQESRIILEKLLNRRITVFSFPFGAFNGKLVESCRQVGYRRVFTTLPVIGFRNGQEFIIGRVATEPTDWPLEFRMKLLGAYRWLPFAFAFKRWILRNPLVVRVRAFRMQTPRGCRNSR